MRCRLALCLLSLLVWQLSIWFFTEYSRRSTSPHIRFITLGVGAISVYYCPNGAASSSNSWQLSSFRPADPWHGLVWLPFYTASSWPGDAEYIAVGLPLWIPAAASALWAARPPRTRRGRCPTCNYPRTGLPPSAPCPECGTPTPPS